MCAGSLAFAGGALISCFSCSSGAMKYCAHCGRQIEDEAVICLNCGCLVSPSAKKGDADPIFMARQNNNHSDLAKWSLICGIVSFFVGWFALGITAMVFANISKEDTGGVMCPRAKAGFYCGLVSTVIYLAVFVIIVAAVTALYV